MEREVLAGRTFLGRRTHPPPFWGVIILDRSASDRLYWWKQAHVKPLPYYCLTDDPQMGPQDIGSMDSDGFFSFVTGKIDAMDPPPGSAITVDVATPLSGDTKASYLNGFCRGWQISKYASTRQLTMLLIMHGGKQIAGNQYLRATDRIIANMGFLGAVDTVSYLTTREESALKGQQEFYVDAHHAPPGRVALDRTEDGLFASTKTPGTPPRITLLRLMDPGAIITRAELVKRAEAADISARSVDRYLEELQKSGDVESPEWGKWCRKQVTWHDMPTN